MSSSSDGNNSAGGSSTGSGSNQKVSPSVEFTAGVIAGAVGLVVGQPFDVVKVRYQTTAFAGQYRSTWGALGNILKHEGTAGLFKGVLSPMAGISFLNGIVFTSYSFFMNAQRPAESDTEPSLAQICLAGAGSGVLSSLICCPTELIKIRQQSAPIHLNPSTWSVARSIVTHEGVRGLYRGLSATMLRDLAYGPYFCTYEAMCRFFKWRKTPPDMPRIRHRHDSLMEEANSELASLTSPELMMAGGVAGVTAWLVTFPVDVMKTRLQSAQSSAAVGSAASGPTTAHQVVPRQTLYAVARDAIRAEGWPVMFAGLAPTLIRAVPVNMMVFLTFELCVASLSRS